MHWSETHANEDNGLMKYSICDDAYYFYNVLLKGLYQNHH